MTTTGRGWPDTASDRAVIIPSMARKGAAAEPLSPAAPDPASWRAAVRGTAATQVWLRGLAAVVALAGALWAVSQHLSGSVLDATRQWDAVWYQQIARSGYNPHAAVAAVHQSGFAAAWPTGEYAFYPAVPALLRGLHLVVPDYAADSLLLSGGAATLAALLLYRVAVVESAARAPDGAAGVSSDAVAAAQEVGRRAVLLLLAFPWAVFLAIGYSESVFLAAALGAWLAVRRGRLGWAAAWGALAVTTRVSGLPLAAGLVVAWWEAGRPVPLRRRWYRAWPLAVPFVAYAGLIAGFWLLTGHLDAVERAELAGWHRQLSWPWVGAGNTVSAALHYLRTSSDNPLFYVWELLAVLGGAVGTALLVRAQRWAGATYVGGCTVILACTSIYGAGMRTALCWFPLAIAGAEVTLRRRNLVVCLAISVPLLLVFAFLFPRGVQLA